MPSTWNGTRATHIEMCSERASSRKRVLKRSKKGVQLHLVCLQCLDTVCPQCVEHVARWDHSLTPNAHGCSACKRVFHHEHWSGRACTKRGYTSGRYGSYRCQQCLEELRSARFERHLLQDAKIQKEATLISEECGWKTVCTGCVHVLTTLTGREARDTVTRTNRLSSSAMLAVPKAFMLWTYTSTHAQHVPMCLAAKTFDARDTELLLTGFVHPWLGAYSAVLCAE